MRHKHTSDATSKFLAITTICFLLLFCVSSAFAQETTGGIQGVVKDAQGAVVSNATVEVSSPALIGTNKATTDGGGYYRFAKLTPGDCDININTPSLGFGKQDR